MLTATFRQVIDGRAGLRPLESAKLPVKLKYSVERLAAACDRAIREFHIKRGKLFEEAGCTVVIDGNGDRQYDHADRSILSQVSSQIEELMDVQIEIQAMALDIEAFGDMEIEGPAFYGLEWASSFNPGKNLEKSLDTLRGK